MNEDSSRSFVELDAQVLERYGPARILINQEYAIVHCAGGANRFLEFDDPASNIVRMVCAELQLELRTALFTAARKNQSVETHLVDVKINDAQRRVMMTVQPIHDPEWAKGYMLVLFHDIAYTGKAVRGTNSSNKVLAQQLEAELQRAKGQLRVKIEQYETAMEEYKVVNEELQTTNEELHTAVEEIEASRTEFQAISEELWAANTALQLKIEEQSQSYDALTDFITSAGIAAIFLDRKQHIRHYTSNSAAIFNIRPTDINRPLSDITHKLAYEQLAADTAAVLTTQTRIEREVRSEDGSWYLARLRPSRAADNSLEGMVLAFIAIPKH